MKRLEGQRFGRLVVLERSQINPHKWRCRCNCGTRVQVTTGHLTSGNTRSSGCASGYRSDVHGGFQ
jgi:hypothetical protein